MKKVCSLALAGLFVLSVTRSGATTIAENFSANPLQNGWQVFGDTNLFHWNSTNQNLDVTWDTSQTNSYFYHPLGVTLTTNDSFCVQFDLDLTDANAVGYFELAVGLCNIAEATSTNFSRANVISPDLFEFDYFPGGPYSEGPSLDATLVDSNSIFYFAFDDSQPLVNGVTYRVVLIHLAGTSTISGEVFTNGQSMTTLPDIYPGGAAGFQLDTLAIENYTTTDDPWGDSLLAHGTVDNLACASPLPAGTINAIAVGKVQLASDTNWLYTLEQTADFQTWTVAALSVPGNGTNLILQAANPSASQSFYRVRADLP